ncbi:MAG: tetratricopeptide repeat protein [Gammaproteobacteria bacterium]|nr:tetratricopeptide repeat protein [Gammaproteobacteria bacterium]
MKSRFILVLFCLLATESALAAGSVNQLQQLIAEQKFAAAAKNGEQLLRQNATHTRTRFLTAYAYQMNAQADRAITLYQSLIVDNPTLPEPRNNLAMIYLEQGDYDRASQLLVEAINTHPSYATAYQNLSQIYKGIASEAYRRAVSESSQPAKYTHTIQLAAITRLDSVEQGLSADDADSQPTAISVANQETLLIERVKLWAQAWSGKDFAAYTDFYSSQHRAKFDTHEQWLAHRRSRILRPGDISVDVSDFQIKWRSESRAIIDFRQAFQSPGYRDRVVKRLTFSMLGSQWKITEEQVLSVL